jgi:hypothetical protein
LSSSAHAQAAQFCRQQSNPVKAKQVYLNTLAVSAVKFYLRCMGIQTDWEASSSCNPVMQPLMDVADLEVTGLGKLECRPVLPNTAIVCIPPDVWSDRIGYVAVQFDQSLREATLLGFTTTAPEGGELPISQLRSLEELLEHLRHLRQSQPDEVRISLSEWFQNRFEADWQSLKALLGTNTENLAYSFRSASELSGARVVRAKLIDMGLQLGSQAVALMVAITPEAEQKVGVLVQVHPALEETYLPANLRLGLLSKLGETLQEVRSRSQDNYIQLKRFRGLPGECFNIQVAFGDASVTEKFVF